MFESNRRVRWTVVCRRWRYKEGLVYTREFWKVMKFIGEWKGTVEARHFICYPQATARDGTPYDMMEVYLGLADESNKVLNRRRNKRTKTD